MLLERIKHLQSFCFWKFKWRMVCFDLWSLLTYHVLVILISTLYCFLLLCKSTIRNLLQLILWNIRKSGGQPIWHDFWLILAPSLCLLIFPLAYQKLGSGLDPRTLLFLQPLLYCALPRRQMQFIRAFLVWFKGTYTQSRPER